MIEKLIWKDLSNSVKEQFETHAKIMLFKRGEFIYRQGDEPQGIYFVESGLVGLTVIGSSGKEHLLRFFRTGQFFGHRSLFSNETYHGSTVALEVTQIKMVPKKVVLAVLKDEPQLLIDVVEVLSKELRRCENQHVLILDNQIHVRVAQALVYLKDLHPSHNWTRQEIANFCASTVSTVIKTLADLEDQGLISQNGRTIEILDRTKLVSMQDDI